MKRIKNPKVSIIMSVYNGEKYLKEAIDSMIRQTFKDFEFIIINDGSTDQSLNIIKSYKDPRIILISRENRGLTESLNEGIKKAKGDYIARMDADDISKKDRLQKQIRFLSHNKDVSLVVSTVELIDQDGNQIQHVWEDDRKAITPKQIEDSMPISDCIAHPAVFARSKLYRNYHYNNVKSGEDYDLWLRLLSEGFKIAKIEEPLLSYRVHEESITQKSNKNGSAKKVIYIKENFLVSQVKLRKWGKIEKKVLKSLKSDYLNYYYELISKDYIKYPFKALLKLARAYNKSKKIKPYFAEKKMLKETIPNNQAKNDKKNVLFVLPWMTTGGADKVALDVSSGLKDEYNWHFITTEPENDNSWSNYFLNVTKNIYHISDFIKFQRNKTNFINNYCKLNNIDTLIISNSISGYKALPLIRKKLKNIRIIDILHGEGGKNDSGGAPKFMQPFEKYIDRHITVTEYVKRYLVDKYKNNPKKITSIHNGVDTDFFKPTNTYSKSIILVWVGRFSLEKRPLAFIELAKKISLMHKNIFFTMVGDGPQFEKAIKNIKDYNLGNRITLLGKTKNSRKAIDHSSALVMTSEIEGQGIVMLEAGSIGKPVFAPKVGGIPEYVVQGRNGIMHNNDQELFTNIENYINNKNDFWKAKKIRENVIKKYSLEKMLDEYKKII